MRNNILICFSFFFFFCYWCLKTEQKFRSNFRMQACSNACRVVTFVTSGENWLETSFQRARKVRDDDSCYNVVIRMMIVLYYCKVADIKNRNIILHLYSLDLTSNDNLPNEICVITRWSLSQRERNYFLTFLNIINVALTYTFHIFTYIFCV